MNIQERIKTATAEKTELEQKYIQTQQLLKNIENTIHAKNGAIEELSKIIAEEKNVELEDEKNVKNHGKATGSK